MPSRKRKAMRDATSQASPESTEKTTKKMRSRKNMILRPQRSASRPTPTAPMTAPSGAVALQPRAALHLGLDWVGATVNQEGQHAGWGGDGQVGAVPTALDPQRFRRSGQQPALLGRALDDQPDTPLALRSALIGPRQVA